MKKCKFFTPQVALLGFVVLAEGIEVKLKAIQTWPRHRAVMEVRCFHTLASFYSGFIRNFGSIMADITKFVKKGTLEWTKALPKRRLNKSNRSNVKH